MQQGLTAKNENNKLNSIEMDQLPEMGPPFFSVGTYDGYFLEASRLGDIRKAIETIRQSTYNNFLNQHKPIQSTDKRDIYYSHIVILNRETRELVAGGRFQLVRPDNCAFVTAASSYLEFSYPDISALLSQEKPFLELSRVYVSKKYQKKSLPMFLVIKAAVKIAVAEGCPVLRGLASYNQYRQPIIAHDLFFYALTQSIYYQPVEFLTPRYPFSPSLNVPDSVLNRLKNLNSVQEMVREIGIITGENFEVPILVRQYLDALKCRVSGLSLGLSFNGLVELLIACDLAQMPPVWLNRMLCE